MADPKVEIAVWAGIPLVVLIVFSLVLDNSKSLGKKNSELSGLVKDYESKYLDKSATIPFEESLSNNKKQLFLH